MAGRRKRGSDAAESTGAPGHNLVMDEQKFQSLYEKVAAAESLMAEARQKAKTAYDDFEGAGGDKKALKAAMRFRTRSAYEQKKHVGNLLRYAKFMDLPVGTQLTFEQITAFEADKSEEEAGDDTGSSVH